MQQKKLTLQEYIQCYNIKKKLRQQSQSKSRSKSKDRRGSNNNIDVHNRSQNSIKNQSIQKNKSALQLNDIYNQVDNRAKNLYQQLQQAIQTIKLQIRDIIRDDKDFAYFIKLMDSLMNKFRLAVMHIHRQNLILFQISNQQNEQNRTISTQRDQLTKTHIQNLQKSFNQKYQLSKTQYEANLSFLPQKTIKQKIKQNKQGQQLLKNIFGGLTNSALNKKNKKVVAKVYDGQPKNEKQRQQRKQQTVSFLGFIMRNIAQAKKAQQNKQILTQLNQTNTQQKINENKTKQPNPKNNQPKLTVNQPKNNINQPKIPIQLKPEKPNQNQKKSLPYLAANQITSNKTQIKINKQNKNNLNTQDQKILKDINFLNSSQRVNINTQQIDNLYDSHNISFGIDSPKPQPKKSQPKTTSNNKKIPPSSQKTPSKTPQKASNIPSNIKNINPKQTKISQQKSPPPKSPKQIPKGPQQNTQPSARPQLIQRTSVTSKNRLLSKGSANKKGA